MTILTWPAEVVPSSYRLRMLSNTQSGGRSPFDGSEQTLELPGARWGAELGFEGLNQTEGRALLGFLASLGGKAGRFTWWPLLPRRGTTGTDGSAGPRIATAGQSGKTVVTTGWAGTGQVAAAGDLIGWLDATGRQQLHMATADVAAQPQTSTNLQVQSINPTSVVFSLGGNTVDLGAVAGADGSSGTGRRLRSGTSGPANVYFGRAAFLAVSPSSAYALSCDLRLNAGSLAAGRALTVDEYNASSVFLARSNGGSITGLGSSWSRQSRTITTRSDTAYLQIYYADGWSVGAELDVGGLQVEPGSVATPLIATAGSAVTRTQAIGIPIWPPIRRSPNANEALSLVSPTAVWRLVDDEAAMDLARGLIGSTRLRFEEAIF